MDADSPSTAAGAQAPEVERTRAAVLDVLRSCFDPEIPVNIYDLGLVYEVLIEPADEVTIRMTLTSPACPVAGSLPGEVEARVAAVPGVRRVRVDLVWDPPWCQDRMSEAAKVQLGFF